MSYLSHLQCTTCGTQLPADRPQTNICANGGILEACYDLSQIRHDVPKESMASGPSSLWRYSALLPLDDIDNRVSLSEGWTPLLFAATLGQAIGCPNLFIKDEGRNPSGTFKDRGAAVAVSRLRELGITTIAHNSSGNAAGSWGLYAARAGLQCVNLVPDDVLPSSLQQSALAGAQTVMLTDQWKFSGGLIADAVQTHGWFNIGTLKEPYRVEGKKTMGYEICEQLGWKLPDAIVYPTGGGLGAIAIYKGIRELMALGWIEDGPLPKLIVSQYEGCAPIVRAFREGKDKAEVWEDLDVLPGGLKSTSPPGDRAVLEILRETNGSAYTATNAESIGAVAEIVRTEGIFPCPESATTLVALRKALAEGIVENDSTVILLSTGSGLKSIDVLPAPEVAKTNANTPLVPNQ